MLGALIGAVQGSEDWSVHDAPAAFTGRYVRAIRVTQIGEGSTALTVVRSDNSTASTGELAVGALEPMIGVKEVTAVGAGVLEYRVYY